MSVIKEMDVNALQALLQNGQVIRLLDVRSIAEMDRGMLPNAEKLPLHTLPVRLNEIANDETVILYCRSGARSAQGVGFMAAQGYDKVYNLRGGVMAWQQNGLPLGV
jgi:rhodanese-related sulfurtransferase